MTDPSALELAWLTGCHAICRLPPKAAIPAWAAGRFLSTTRTADELSIVCECGAVPDDVRHEAPFAMFRVVGAMHLNQVGVLAALSRPLADAGVPLFSIATFDTDYVLVREADRERATTALEAAGHRFVDDRKTAGA